MMNPKKLFVFFLILSISIMATYMVHVVPVSAATNYYIAPNGNDNNPGTISQPFATLTKAWTVISAGDTVYLRDGTYYLSGNYPQLVGVNGTSTNPINIYAYPGETPVITKASPGYTGTMGIYFHGDYFHWKGIRITGFAQPQSGSLCSGMFVTDSSHNTFELMTFDHNGHGMRIQGANATGNLVLNCDFHHNQDPYTSGDPYGNADGLEVAYIGNSCTNTVTGCRFWWNTDDGLDLWQNDGTLIAENNWAWYNGYIPDTFDTGGDGNGFKLGSTTANYSTQLLRKIDNNLSFYNRAMGVNQNGANCKIQLYNNTVYHNATHGISLYQYDILHVLKNNISYNNNSGVDFYSQYPTTNDYNTWNGQVTVTDADFVSVSLSGVDGQRRSDGSLPDIDFMKLAAGSDLIDAGVDVGITYNGSAPDMGAFENSAGASTPTPTPTPTPTATATPSPVISELVCNDTANAADWSVRANIQQGDSLYGDRTYTVNTMPSAYAGLAWIRTACDSKTYTNTTLCTFKVNYDSTVYVVHNDLISPRPSWLTSGFTDTGDNLVSSDVNGPNFSIFYKTYSAGSTVSLGQNGNTDETCYTIIVKNSIATPTPTPTPTPSPVISELVCNDTANAADWSVRANIQQGDSLYEDRTYTVNTLPSAYAGLAWIRTACDSKTYTNTTLCTFKVNYDSTVYVVHNDLISPRPSWLTSNFTDTGDNLVSSDINGPNFSIFYKTYSAGSTVSLGQNGNTDETCYTIIVKKN